MSIRFSIRKGRHLRAHEFAPIQSFTLIPYTSLTVSRIGASFISISILPALWSAVYMKRTHRAAAIVPADVPLSANAAHVPSMSTIVMTQGEVTDFGDPIEKTVPFFSNTISHACQQLRRPHGLHS